MNVAVYLIKEAINPFHVGQQAMRSARRRVLRPALQSKNPDRLGVVADQAIANQEGTMKLLEQGQHNTISSLMSDAVRPERVGNDRRAAIGINVARMLQGAKNPLAETPNVGLRGTAPIPKEYRGIPLPDIGKSF